MRNKVTIKVLLQMRWRIYSGFKEHNIKEKDAANEEFDAKKQSQNYNFYRFLLLLTHIIKIISSYTCNL